MAGKRREPSWLAPASATVLAIGGVSVLGVAVLGWLLHCWDVCDPRSEGWLSRAGAWERPVQLALGSACAAFLFASGVLAARARWRSTAFALGVAVALLVAWLIVFV
jgi:hypothetical protein